MIYHYFPNKRDFFAAVVRYGVESAIRTSRPDESLPPRQRLRAGLDQLLAYVERNENGFRAIHRGRHSADEEIRAIVAESRSLHAARIIDQLDPPGGASPALRLALEGWMSFSSEVILDWLETRELARDALLDLMTGALAGIVAAALATEGSAELPGLAGDVRPSAVAA